MKQFAITHCKEPIADDSCICRAYHLDIKRHRSDPDYVPKWEKITRSVPESTISSSKCCYDALLQKKLIKTIFTSIKSIKEMLHIPLEHTEVILLCPIYKKFKLACCSSCGACPKQSFGTVLILVQSHITSVLQLLKLLTVCACLLQSASSNSKSH